MLQDSDVTTKEIKIVADKIRETATQLGIHVDDSADFVIIDEKMSDKFSDNWMKQFMALESRLTQNIAMEFASSVLQSADDVPRIESADRVYELQALEAKHGHAVTDEYCTELEEFLKEREDRSTKGLYLLESDVSRLIVGPYAQADYVLTEAIARQASLRQLAARYQLPSDRRDVIIILNPEIVREFVSKIRDFKVSA